MRPPLSYYGGKQKLRKAVLTVLYQSPNWDANGTYCEPFFGGGAVFFAKDAQKVECINDINDSLITFYRVVKDPAGFEKVKALLDGTLFSRTEYNRTVEILRGREEAGDIEKAWAVFAHLNMAFGHSWFGGYGISVTGGSKAKGFANKKRGFTEEVCARLENVDIECRDALWVIGNRDRESTLFYVDPPYAGTVQKYAGNSYGAEDLARLCGALASIKGEFVLSGFPHPALDEACERHGWHRVDIRQSYSMQLTDEDKLRDGKTEVIVASFPFGLDVERFARKLDN